MTRISSLIDFGYLVRVTYEPYLISYQAIMEGDNTGWLLLGITLAMHIFILVMFKLIIYNSVFPRLRTIDHFNNRTVHCRLYVKAKPEVRRHRLTDMFSKQFDSDYYWVKFRMFPIFEFYKIRIKKGWRRRRFPWTLDIFTESININWNPSLRTWDLQKDPIGMKEEEIKYYKEEAKKNIVGISDNVLTGVKGDYSLIKNKFKLGLSVQRVKHGVTERKP